MTALSRVVDGAEGGFEDAGRTRSTSSPVRKKRPPSRAACALRQSRSASAETVGSGEPLAKERSQRRLEARARAAIEGPSSTPQGRSPKCPGDVLNSERTRSSGSLRARSAKTAACRSTRRESLCAASAPQGGAGG